MREENMDIKDSEFARMRESSMGMAQKKPPALRTYLEELNMVIRSFDDEFESLYVSLDHVFVSRPSPTPNLKGDGEISDHSDTVSSVVGMIHQIETLRGRLRQLREGLEV